MQEDRIELAKWRWECIRRNREYLSDEDFIKSNRLKGTPEEREIAEKYDLFEMLDPNKSFDELFEVEDDNVDDVREKRWLHTFHEQMVLKSLSCNPLTLDKQPPFIKEKIKLITGEEEEVYTTNADPPNILTIRIDLSKVRSKTDLKKIVNALIDQRLEVVDKLRQKKAEGDLIAGFIPDEHLLGNIKKNKTYFEGFLLAGDLERKGLNHEQIARKLFPRDFKGKSDNEKPESKIRLISKYCSAYKELIDKQGYKKLTYP